MPLGWLISVYRQSDGGRAPATRESAKGTRIAIWQAQVYGLQWLDALVKTGKAVSLGGNGYPYWYTARAETILRRIEKGLPHENPAVGS